MKKLLSLTLALMLGMAAFAQITQDAYWEMFNDANWQSNGWQTEEWTLSTGADPSVYIGAPGGFTGTSWIVSPYMTFNSADELAGGSFSFYVQTADLGNDAATAVYTVDVILGQNKIGISGQGITLASADGWTEQSLSYSIILNAINNGGLPGVQLSYPLQVAVQVTLTSMDYDGALVVDDFKMRKRENAYFIRYFDYEENYMSYDVCPADGNYIASAYNGQLPTGKGFAYWGVYSDQGQFLNMALIAGDGISGVDQDLILFAELGDLFKIHFNANGGQGTMADFNATSNTYNVLPVCTFTRQGYTFSCWNTAADGTGEMYANEGEYLQEVAQGNAPQDVTLYAIWTEGQGGGQGEGGQGGGQGEGGGQGGGQGEGGQGGGTSAIDGVSMANISIYPNPTKNMIRVNGASINSLEVMDLTGRKVLRNEGVNTIDLSGLNNGVYMLRINANEGTAIRKIVKK